MPEVTAIQHKQIESAQGAKERSWFDGEVTVEQERFGAKVKEVLTGLPHIFVDNGELVDDIIYQTPDNQSFSLKSLLPEGWGFTRVPYEELGAKPFLPAPKVIYGENGPIKINEKGFFLGLLHEFGHATIFKGMDEKELEEYAAAYANCRKAREQEIEPDPDSLAKVLKSERDAWAWGLRTFRRLRIEGFDLEPELRTKEEILKGVNRALKSHGTFNPEEVSKFRLELSPFW